MTLESMTRAEIQKRAVELMRDTPLLILQWCTGLGKSKAAIDIIKDLSKDRIDILLVVSEIAHKENWKKEFLKWGLPSNVGILIETYASLKNHKKEVYDLIILDEAHHAGSDLRMEVLEEIKSKKVLALSATLPSEMGFKLGLLYGRKMSSFKVSLQQAIDWGILPKPKLYLIPMTLDNTRLTQIIIEEWGRKEKRRTVKCSISERWTYMKDKATYPHMRLEIECTELQKYLYLSDQIEFWKRKFLQTMNGGVKNKWLRFGSERKRFLGSLKDNTAKKVLTLIKDKRYICFCSSIEQAEKLGGNNSIHSKKKGALNTIEDFNNKKINNLFVIGMIQEGQNLVDTGVGIVIQLDGQERAFIQKSGRTMRVEDPVLFILYYKDTRDEEYLQTALEDINPDYITEVTDLSEIKI